MVQGSRAKIRMAAVLRSTGAFFFEVRRGLCCASECVCCSVDSEDLSLS
jgi:uncharacterized Fe-S cluster-containing radical SAM superfamily enzyme